MIPTGTLQREVHDSCILFFSGIAAWRRRSWFFLGFLHSTVFGCELDLGSHGDIMGLTRGRPRLWDNEPRSFDNLVRTLAWTLGGPNTRIRPLEIGFRQLAACYFHLFLLSSVLFYSPYNNSHLVEACHATMQSPESIDWWQWMVKLFLFLLFLSMAIRLRAILSYLIPSLLVLPQASKTRGNHIHLHCFLFQS